MFRTDLLSVIRSLKTVFTAIGICHTSYAIYPTYLPLCSAVLPTLTTQNNLEKFKYDNCKGKIKRLEIFWSILDSNSYNKTQRDALFLNFILAKNSTCFGQIYCPSSGVLTI